MRVRVKHPLSIILFVSLLGGLHSYNAFAQQLPTSVKESRRVTVRKGDSLGFSLIFGGEYGIILAKSKAASFSDKKGSVAEMKALAGFETSNFLLDGGLGWYNLRLRGEEVLQTGTIEDNEVGVSGVSVEFNPSFKTGFGMYLGLSTQLKTPLLLSYESTAEAASVGFSAGAQIGYEIETSDLNARFLAKYMTTLGLKGWQDQVFLGGLQIGLPIKKPDTRSITKTTVIKSKKEIIDYRKKSFTITVTADVIKLALDNTVSFYGGRSNPTLTPSSQSFLVDLGGSLQQAISAWETLRIDAESGTHMKLIKESLVSTGVPPNKVRNGKRLPPIDDGGTVSVDFTFTGVQDIAALQDAIRQAMKAMKIPENCSNGVCE
jgi:hypothetical protein